MHSILFFYNLIGGWEFNRATNEVVVLRDLSAGAPTKKK